jgi:hypothetical protein
MPWGTVMSTKSKKWAAQQPIPLADKAKSSDPDLALTLFFGFDICPTCIIIGSLILKHMLYIDILSFERWEFPHCDNLLSV